MRSDHISRSGISLFAIFKKALPLLQHMHGDRATWRKDLASGICLAFFLAPQSMACAQLAGLPPHYGLYAAFLPPIIAGFLGRCPQLHTGPVAIHSLMTFAVLSAMPGLTGHSSLYIEYAMALALLSGIILFIFGIFRLSAIANLLSYPVIIGFINAAVLVIIATQIGLVAQLPVKPDSLFVTNFFFQCGHLQTADLASLYFAISTLIAVILLRRFFPGFPGIMVVIPCSIVISAMLKYESCYNGIVVGPIPIGLPAFHWPALTPAAWLRLVPAAAVIAAIGFVEVLSITKMINNKTGQRLYFNHELVAQGAASITSGLMQGYPVSGSFSRSALNLYMGATTGWANVTSGLVIAIILLWCTSLLYHLPKAVLAAIIMIAAGSLLNLKAMWQVCRGNRTDAITVWLTFVATLAFAPHITKSILIGVVFAVSTQMYRLMKPKISRLGRFHDGTLRDAQWHGLATDPRILVLRFDGRLVFANAAHFDEKAREAIAAAPDLQAFLLDASGINEMDETGLEMLQRLFYDLHARGLRIVVGRLRARFKEDFNRAGLYELVGDKNFFTTTESALSNIEQWLDQYDWKI